jgi:hypothetical protein
MPKFWTGPPPTHCELCNTKIKYLFVRGKTVWGIWAVFCPKCLDDCGLGIGRGRGELYLRGESKRSGRRLKWTKIAG